MEKFELNIGKDLSETKEKTWVASQVNETKDEVASLIMTPRNLDYEKVTEKLVKQLSEYLEKSHQAGYVIWVSGGIDSAVVSTLCAMTGKKLVILDMPIHQATSEVTRAYEHINWLQGQYLNVESHKIDLTETFETFKKALPEVSDEMVRYMAYVNTRSRLRAVTLYAIWNEKSCLVAGTGNKVEDYGIWFFTKFGDWAVDLSPIGNLYKSEVYELAKYLWIVESIQKARPTDGLHPNGATDEDQIWATYDELEWAMVQYDSWKRVIDFEGRAAEVMKIYTQRHEINQHKMNMPPVFEI